MWRSPRAQTKAHKNGLTNGSSNDEKPFRQRHSIVKLWMLNANCVHGKWFWLRHATNIIFMRRDKRPLLGSARNTHFNNSNSMLNIPYMNLYEHLNVPPRKRHQPPSRSTRYGDFRGFEIFEHRFTSSTTFHIFIFASMMNDWSQRGAYTNTFS